MSKPAGTLVSFHSFVSASVSVSRSLLVFDGGGGGGGGDGDRASVLEVRKFSCHAGESFLLIFGNCLFVTPERCLGRFAPTPGLKGVTAEERSGSSVMNRRSCSLFYQSG